MLSWGNGKWGNEEKKSSGNEEKSSKESTGNKIMEGKTRGSEPLIRDYLHAASEGKISDVQIYYEQIKGDFHVDVTLDDDDKKLTALMYACMFAHLEVVQFLLEKGASLEATTSVGATPTYYAAGAQGERRLDVLKLCLEYKIEKSSCLRKNVCTRRGRTLPWIAACNGMFDTLEKIISLGELDLNKKSTDGMTPLMIATINGHDSCVKVLIKAVGVDLHAKMPSSGWTAIAIAKALGKDKCLDILKNAILAGTKEMKIEFQKKMETEMQTEGEVMNYNDDEIVQTLMEPPEFPMDKRYSSEQKHNDDIDVDEMKVQTMYKMVDDCRVVVHGMEVRKKVLYLTNKQASKLDESAMERVVQALDIKEPKFVIKLLPSTGSAKQMSVAHSELIGSKELEYGQSTSASSEISADDERVVETQILLFMKNCILPLANATDALILVGGSNDCILSASLSKIALAEQARLGKDCRFTVLATAKEQKIHANAVAANKSSLIAAQIAGNSIAWKKRLAFMNKFYSRTMLKNALDKNANTSTFKLPQCDLTEAADRYIIFEGYEEGLHGSEGYLNDGPQKAFESVFLQYMTKKLPSIAIQCFNAHRGFQFLVDLTNRNIPVLLLDTSERCITSTKCGSLTKLATDSNAFPRITKEQCDQLLQMKTIVQPDIKGMNDIEKAEQLHKKGMEVLLTIAVRMIEDRMVILEEQGVIDNLNTSLMAFFHHVLTLRSRLSLQDNRKEDVPLYKRIRDLEILERTSKDVKTSHVDPELVTFVLNYICSRVAASNVKCQLKRVKKWILKHDKKYHYMHNDAVMYKEALKRSVKSINNNNELMTGNDFDSSAWMAQFELLMSPNTYSGSVFDLDEIKRMLSSVAKIDRLPRADSLEALRTLQDAWDHVELYHIAADRFKLISKLAYLAILLTGIAITAFSQMESNLFFDSHFFIIALSFLASSLAAYVAYVNPTVKWHQLRVAALTIESNIWMFRTRAGPYRTTGEEFDQSSERLLADALRNIKTGVLEGADVKSTSFYSRKKSYNKHQQHEKGERSFGATDNILPVLNPKAKWYQCCQRNGGEDDTKESITHYSRNGDGTNNRNSIALYSRNNVSWKNRRDSFAHNSESNDSSTKLPDIRKLSPPASSDNQSATPVATCGNPSDASDNERSAGDNSNAAKGIGLNTPCLLKTLSILCKHDGDSEIEEDTHYQPVKPDNFLRFRIMPVLMYYKKKIPIYARGRAITQTLLVLGSAASAVLAIAELSEWAAIVSVSTVSITAYQEFCGTSKKMSRYSHTVHGLEELIFWW